MSVIRAYHISQCHEHKHIDAAKYNLVKVMVFFFVITHHSWASQFVLDITHIYLTGPKIIHYCNFWISICFAFS